MDTLNFNIFNIIIISGVIHGIIFSIIVLRKKHLVNVLYLGLTVLFLSLSNLQYWLIDTTLINYHSALKYIYIPWHWLILPMFYLYVHKFIGRKKLTVKKRLLLFVPFFGVLLIHVLQVLYKLIIDATYELPSHFGRGIFVYLEFLSFAFNIAVMYYTITMIIAHEKDTSHTIAWVKSETNWLKKLIYIGLAVCCMLVDSHLYCGGL